MVPQSIKDKIVPKELQELVGASVPRIDTDAPAEKPESVTPETSPPPPASSRKIDIAPAPPVRREIAPEPIQEEKEQEVLEEEEEEKDVKVDDVTGVVEDGGIVVRKVEDEEKVLSTILKIDPADLEAVQALLKSRSGSQVVLQ
jgi:hypothetical protein